MATVKNKKRMMYAVFVFIFIFGGIEYAVILPTLWLYLHSTYNSPDYMLGLVLSAYSFAAFLSSPVFGRLSDRLRCTKYIFLICSTFELLGSFLYFVGVSQWLCVGSRFISGLGAGSEAIALAEVARYTTEKERTGIISYLVASRQIALLIGPGLNLFLRMADFKIGIFVVNKFSSPGAFMVIMWAFLMLIILTMYTEPKLIYCEAERERQQREIIENDVSPIMAASTVETSERIAYTSNPNLPINKFNNRIERPNSTASHIQETGNGAEEKTSDNGSSKFKDLLISEEGPDFIFPPLLQEAANQSMRLKKSPSFSNASDFSETSRDFHDTRPPTQSSEDSCVTITDENHAEVRERSNTHLLSCSVDLMVSAERIINNTQWLNTPSSQKEYWSKDGLYFNEDHFGFSVESDLVFGNSTEIDEQSPLIARRSKISRNSSGLMKSQGYNEPYIERSTSALDDPIAREGKIGFFCNEYIRDEIIAIVCLLFCAMFSQVCLETMVLPLTFKYLDFDELENSILYCICGVEIIIVFVVITRLSHCISDRVLMLFGAVIILATNIWLLWYLPNAIPHNMEKNMPYFAVSVFLDILSLPFLLVCSTSLYSKLTRKETAGLSQGLRRGVVGLGTIIAPLWGSSAVKYPYILLGVLVGLQALSLVLCILSFKRLKVPTASSTTHVGSRSALAFNAGSSSPSNHQPNHNTSARSANIPVSHSNHSTPYGSIQRSYNSSYHSVSSLAERRSLQHNSV